MNNNKLERYVKNKDGEKVVMVTRSVNIEKSQQVFVEENNLNLSLMVRDLLSKLMEQEKKESIDNL